MTPEIQKEAEKILQVLEGQRFADFYSEDGEFSNYIRVDYPKGHERHITREMILEKIVSVFHLRPEPKENYEWFCLDSEMTFGGGITYLKGTVVRKATSDEENSFISTQSVWNYLKEGYLVVIKPEQNHLFWVHRSRLTRKTAH